MASFNRVATFFAGLSAASAAATGQSAAPPAPAGAARDAPLPIPQTGLPSPYKPPPVVPKDRCFTLADGQTLCFKYVASAQAIGGQRVEKGSAPWQAQIYSQYPYSLAETAIKPLWELQHRCGGSLIAPGWVLTAAHCLENEPSARNYRVQLGTEDISLGDGATYRIAGIVRHANYDPATKLNDIALLRIVPAEGSRVPPPGRVKTIALYDVRKGDPPLRPNEEVLSTGWGLTQPGPDGRASAVLIEVDIRLITHARCAAAGAKYRAGVDGTVLCAMSDGRDTCTGDSGGPMVLQPRISVTHGGSTHWQPAEPRLIGIVSWGEGCAQTGKPGVYTRVSSFRDWIARAMTAPPGETRLR